MLLDPTRKALAIKGIVRAALAWPLDVSVDSLTTVGRRVRDEVKLV